MCAALPRRSVRPPYPRHKRKAPKSSAPFGVYISAGGGGGLPRASKVSTGDFCARLCRAALFDPRIHATKEKPQKLCAFWGFISVPVVGVEPTRCHHQRILSPSRLPIPTHRLICCLYSILQALRKIKIYFVLIFAPPGMQYCLYYTGYNKISGVTILKRFFHMAQLCLCRAGKPQGTVSDPFGLQKMKRTTSILLPIP